MRVINVFSKIDIADSTQPRNHSIVTRPFFSWERVGSVYASDYPWCVAYEKLGSKRLTLLSRQNRMCLHFYNDILVYIVAFQLSLTVMQANVCGQSRHPLFKWVESTHHHQWVQRGAQVPLADLLQWVTSYHLSHSPHSRRTNARSRSRKWQQIL